MKVNEDQQLTDQDIVGVMMASIILNMIAKGEVNL